ncbi:MAG TPA: hydantoinase/oxoprolinase family protein, partial [Lacipirellulaceae bacterium]|nr:hydantoinase/oxoprolinase family protein [Lacipirellulaceae bacterium]
MPHLALDIGGANLKGADGRGWTSARPFALWKAPLLLREEVASLLAGAPPHDAVAVTMTGELADCFRTKAEGVEAIAGAVAAAASRPVEFYGVDGNFHALAAAISQPLTVAASNWHALATFACRFILPGDGVLIDIGSTTTDVIPLGSAGPATGSRTDPDRLTAGELVYTGVERTAACALVGAIAYRGASCPVAAEFFATTLDAYLTLGALPEEPLNCDTADGRPRTRACARDRLARLVCADRTLFTDEDTAAAASAIQDAQIAKISVAVEQVIARMRRAPSVVVLSGQGEFLGRRVASRVRWGAEPPRVVSLEAALGSAVSRCAPAHALAVLAAERAGPAKIPPVC